MSIRPAKARAPWVGISGGSVINQDGGIYYDSTTGLLSTGIIPFWDTFDSSKPFWNETEVLSSGDWQIDTGNGWLEGLAENNAYDWFRQGVEGDYDYIMKVDRNDASSAGFEIYNSGETVTQTLYIADDGADNKIVAIATGKSNVTISGLDSPIAWLRVVRRKNTIYYYYRLTDTATWTLITSYSDVDLGHSVSANLDSATNAEIHEVLLWDNMMPDRIMATAPKSVRLGNITGNVAIDARRGNLFFGTLTGNITLQNPTNVDIDYQMIHFILTQDGTGSRTISFGADYDFSTDLPSPTLSTAAGAVDHLGFIYNPNADKWQYIAEVFGF